MAFLAPAVTKRLAEALAQAYRRESLSVSVVLDADEEADRTMPRAEVHGAHLAKQITQAKREVASAITRASKLLEKCGADKDEIGQLVETKVINRIAAGQQQ